MLTLNAEKRDMKANIDALRKAGKMPAIYYGKKRKSTPIAVSLAEFAKIWKKAGESTVVTLKDGNEELDSLIYDTDRDPITETFRHADFYVFEKGQKIKVKVPVEFAGVAPAVKDLGGVLVKVIHTLEVEAEPKNLPAKLDIDIGALKDFTSQIFVKDIKLPAGVSAVAGANDVVASVYEPKEEKEEVVAAPDLSTIEVAKKGKEAKEGEAPAEGAEAEKGTTPAPASAAKAGDKKQTEKK